MAEVDGLNAGYARAVLEEYLENPEAVPAEWRELFEGDSTLLRGIPASRVCSRCSRRTATALRPKPPRPPAPRPSRRRRHPCRSTRRSRRRCGGGVSREGVQDTRPPRRAPRSARLRAGRRSRPGARVAGPPVDAEIQVNPARLLRVHVPGETLADVLPKLPGGLLRRQRLRDRAHLRPPGAGLAAAGDRIRHLQRAAGGGRQAPAPRAPLRGGGARALPPQERSSGRSSSRSKGST